MLGEEEKREIEEETLHYDQKRAACIGALKIVQRHHGWISDEALQDVADILEMTADELDGVATFYYLLFRRPVGRHVIMVCDSVSCWGMRYEQILAHLSARLGIAFGETSPDGRFTLLTAQCLAACDHAPAMMVDEQLFGDLDAG